MAQRNGFYPTGLAVPGKKIAGGKPINAPETPGTNPLSTVPQHPGVGHGLGPATHTFSHPSVKGAHGYGHPPKARVGHLRMSNVTGSHRIGALSKLK